MIYTDKYFYPSCPAMDWDCPYIDKCGFCKMYEQEKTLPYLECEYWEGSDEAEELISIECMKESAGW